MSIFWKCVGTHVSQRHVEIKRQFEGVLCFCHVGSGTLTQVVRLGSKSLYLLNLILRTLIFLGESLSYLFIGIWRQNLELVIVLVLVIVALLSAKITSIGLDLIVILVLRNILSQAGLELTRQTRLTSISWLCFCFSLLRGGILVCHHTWLVFLVCIYSITKDPQAPCDYLLIQLCGKSLLHI